VSGLFHVLGFFFFRCLNSYALFLKLLYLLEGGLVVKKGCLLTAVHMALSITPIISLKLYLNSITQTLSPIP
jgi:uncharacterized membrane protein YpjA